MDVLHNDICMCVHVDVYVHVGSIHVCMVMCMCDCCSMVRFDGAVCMYTCVHAVMCTISDYEHTLYNETSVYIPHVCNDAYIICTLHGAHSMSDTIVHCVIYIQ